jgi:phosphoribosyl 1,2-cyclic phosphodiesterase
MKDVDALIISHDHADHVRHMGVYARRYGFPVYVTSGTLDMAMSRHGIGAVNTVRTFSSGDEIMFSDVSVLTIPSPHDGREGSLFVVRSKKKSFGIFTDVGHAFGDLYRIMPSLDAVFIESNYDADMLMRGPYPVHLKRRIQGSRGHLSNRDAAELIRQGLSLKWACLAHLSEHNNSPAAAVRTHREVLGDEFQLYIASRYEVSDMLLL